MFKLPYQKIVFFDDDKRVNHPIYHEPTPHLSTLYRLPNQDNYRNITFCLLVRNLIQSFAQLNH